MKDRDRLWVFASHVIRCSIGRVVRFPTRIRFGHVLLTVAYFRLILCPTPTSAIKPSPAWDEWVIGSEAFLKRIVKLAEQQDPTKQDRKLVQRRLRHA